LIYQAFKRKVDLPITLRRFIVDEPRTAIAHTSWNKGKLIGQKAPFKISEIWAIRSRLQLENRTRELALFNLGLDSKLRACDLMKLHVQDICHGDRVAARAMVMQKNPSRPVQFEISESTRTAVNAWITSAHLRASDFLFPSRIHKSPHLGTRQYARIVDGWVSKIGLDPCNYGTHSMRRTKATLIYRRSTSREGPKRTIDS